MKCIFCPKIIEDNQKPIGSICKDCFYKIYYEWESVELDGG